MKTLHRGRGVANDLIVTQQGNTLTLWAGSGLRHTVLDLDAPHMPGLEYARNTLLALAFTPNADSILMLGLGGGSILHMLRAARPHAGVDAIEIDPAILQLARKFFRVGDSSWFKVYLEDAAVYLEHCRRRYDIILVDTYVGASLAAQCTTREFFENARRSLSPHGVLVINWMSSDPQRYRRVLANVEAASGSVWQLHGYRSRNTLIFATARKVERAELLTAADRLERDMSFASAIAPLARRIQLYTPRKP